MASLQTDSMIPSRQVEESREGILVGALDFDHWKNGLVCSATDANTIEARSGFAGAETHDARPHGVLTGREVTSARFGILYGGDYRKLLEAYGDFLRLERAPLEWKYGVPFGFNSWAGLAFRLNGERYENSGNFLKNELTPPGYENRGTTYVNLDAGWTVLPEERLAAQVERLHLTGQKAGIYDMPFAYFGQDAENELFDAVQVLTASNAKAAPAGRTYLFSSILPCASFAPPWGRTGKIPPGLGVKRGSAQTGSRFYRPGKYPPANWRVCRNCM